ncbi:hypothetical protein PS941_03815 [Pseudomonas fluorescens]|uniref:Uncharacterized protein n=2 Tax=Pseudomonas fluorescens TaxID=294 RepID=A0A5E7UKK8_PSEFL|nr:hypothetical protein PS941_03815 [Pseudomonas fluorescens]
MAACQPTNLLSDVLNPFVGASLLAMAACQPTNLLSDVLNPFVGASLLAKAACQSTVFQPYGFNSTAHSVSFGSWKTMFPSVDSY